MKIKFKLQSANFPVRTEVREVKSLYSTIDGENIGFIVAYNGIKDFIVKKHEVIEVLNPCQKRAAICA